VPLFEGHGMHLGNPNMPVLQQGIRNFFTLFLAEDPAMKSRVPEVERLALARLHEIVNEHGAEMSAVHYINAGFVPTLNTLLQLRMSGRDHFGTEPRLARFAEFYLNSVHLCEGTSASSYRELGSLLAPGTGAGRI
jgi:hypothetical protein